MGEASEYMPTVPALEIRASLKPMSKAGERLIRAAKERRGAVRGRSAMPGSARRFLKAYEDYLRLHWGPRCRDVEPGCPVCQAWRRYDAEHEAWR